MVLRGSFGSPVLRVRCGRCCVGMRLHPFVPLLAALALASCGGGSGSDSAGPTTTSPDRDAARLRLEECMRDHGVDVESGKPIQGRNGELDEAMKACERFRDEAFGELSDEDRQELQDQVTELTQCLRDHGVDAPDVKVGDGGATFRMRARPDDADTKEAMEACRDKMPRRGEPR
jgi:hypothetical protein